MAKNTAHRPSQSHLKYVKNSRGDRVLNTAYKPAPWEKQSDEQAAAKVRYDASTPGPMSMAPGGFDSVSDQRTRDVLAISGLGDARAGYESMQAVVDEDYDDVFDNRNGYYDGYHRSHYGLTEAINEPDAMKHVANEVTDSLELRYYAETGKHLTDAEKDRISADLVSSGFVSGTKFGAAIERADSIANMQRIQNYAATNGFSVQATPDRDYMGSPSWAGSRSSGYDEDEKTDDLKATLRDMKAKNMLSGRTSVSRLKYHTRNVKVKSPGFDSLSSSQRNIVQSRVERALSPITSAYDYDAGNSQYDYFNYNKTRIIVTA